ncbi:hypothetical protein BDR22DRAFT_487514 [Usnea florida]
MELPNEIILEILRDLCGADLKNARLLCKLWSSCASEYLFTKVFFSPHQLNIDTFGAIAQHTTLRRFVQEIEYDPAWFSPHITIAEYLDILSRQISTIDVPTTRTYEILDPQIQQFLDIQNFFGQAWTRNADRTIMDRRVCCHFGFVQEGYRKWMEQAAFEEKSTKDGTFLTLLARGLMEFDRLRTVKLSAEWPSQGMVRPEGSPLARSWHPFHAHPDGWVLDPDERLRGNSPRKNFCAVALALSKAGKSTIRKLSVESNLLPNTFVAESGEADSFSSRAMAAYRTVEDLKLCLAAYAKDPLHEIHNNLHRLHRLLLSMTVLKRFELILPDDFVSEPMRLFPYTKVFPSTGLWSHLTTLTISNLEVGTKDLITLLFNQIPNLRRLTLGNMVLLDGEWEGIIEYLRVANRLSSFWFTGRFMLLHRGGHNYFEDSFEAFHSKCGAFYKFLTSVEDYVVNWSTNPTLIHPNLTEDHPPYRSLDYLRNVFRLCEVPAASETIDKLRDQMLVETERYRRSQETCIQVDSVESPEVGI